MREAPIIQLADMMASHPAEKTIFEGLRGHFFQLDLFSIDGGCGETSLTGGALRCGSECIALDLDHARQLADRVRAAIDNCVAGSIIQPPACRDGGH